MVVSINVNDRAKVKLSDSALKRWRENAERMNTLYPGKAGLGLWPLTHRVDEDGYWHAQLWEILRLIGPDCSPGHQPTADGFLYVEVGNGR